MAKRRRNVAKEQFWRQVMARRERSGLTVRAFCARERLSEPSFYVWRRELARRDQLAARVTTAPSTPSLFMPIEVVTERHAALEIVLPRGAVLRVWPGFDRQTLEQVVTLLARDASTGGASC